ncbi:MAG: endolytic transglycosylase MltG [Candidatus Aminicenantes bacterium]|nr:endolytic transglycosylase MltG [Candidatus Aminicenantes bacterium]
MIRRLFIVLIGLILLLAAVSAFLFFSSFNRSPDGSPERVLFTVDPGKSASSVADDLHKKGIIENKWPILIGYRLYFSAATIKAGEYSFDLPLPPRRILEILTGGKVNLYSLTIHEGLTRHEMAPLVAEQLQIDPERFIEEAEKISLLADLDGSALNLEGYLFPETYHLPAGSSAGDVISAMVTQFKQIFTEEWKKRAEELGLSIRDIVILASLIEKETAVDEERRLVSAVFHNRLRRHMKLDCDPTIIYALKEQDSFTGNLRKRDLEWDHPYNTYKYGGLPPGPIANPGKDSLYAALYPADVNFLYFVSKNDGSHHFSASYREHVNAVNEYQRKKR